MTDSPSSVRSNSSGHSDLSTNSEIPFNSEWLDNANEGNIAFFKDSKARAKDKALWLDRSDKNDDDYSPLCVAAKEGHVDCVGLLLDLGADINFQQTEWNQSTALMKATERNRVEVVSLMLTKKCAVPIDVNKVNTAGNTALMIACEKNNHVIASLLLQHGADINRKNHSGYTALILAAEMDSFNCVNVLLSFPKLGLFRNKVGYIIEHPVVVKRRSLRRSSGCSSSSSSSSSVSSSSSSDAHLQYHQDSYTESTPPRVCVNDRNKFGKTALMMAAENGHKNIVKILCEDPENPADINVQSNRNATALSLGAMKGRLDVVKYLGTINVLDAVHNECLL